jgi:hypothetical protein
MDAYQIRRSLLEMAKNMLTDEYHLTINGLEQEYHQKMNIIDCKEIPFPKLPPYPTVDKIVELARQLNEFVSDNKRPQPKDDFTHFRGLIHEIKNILSKIIPSGIDPNARNSWGTQLALTMPIPEYDALKTILNKVEQLHILSHYPQSETKSDARGDEIGYHKEESAYEDRHRRRHDRYGGRSSI